VLLKGNVQLKSYAVITASVLVTLPRTVRIKLDVSSVLHVMKLMNRVYVKFTASIVVGIIQLLVLSARHIYNDMRILQNNIQSICTSLPLLQGWWRGSVVERRSLAGELSLSCARPAADG